MKISILPKAKKALSKIPQDAQDRIVKQIDNLAKEAIPHGAKKLTNQPGFRIRVGNWRVLYLIDKNKKKIIIARIAHRKDIYR